MPTSRKKLATPVVRVVTGTVIYIKESNYSDQLHLEAANLTSASATLDLLMGGELICQGVILDPNSPPFIITDNLVCFSTITANCVPTSAIALTGHALRFSL